MTGRGLYVFIYNTGTMVCIVWVTAANISHYVTKIYWATNLLTTSRCCVIVSSVMDQVSVFLLFLYLNNKEISHAECWREWSEFPA